jgi:hypothetical protein
MEEQQIQEFIHRVCIDKAVQDELALDAESMIRRENYSPRVAHILLRLAPCLVFGQSLSMLEKWWHV